MFKKLFLLSAFFACTTAGVQAIEDQDEKELLSCGRCGKAIVAMNEESPSTNEESQVFTSEEQQLAFCSKDETELFFDEDAERLVCSERESDEEFMDDIEPWISASDDAEKEMIAASLS